MTDATFRDALDRHARLPGRSNVLHNLKPHHMLAALMISSGHRDSTISEFTGLSEKYIGRLRSDPQVDELVRAHIAELGDRSTDAVLTQLVGEMPATIRALARFRDDGLRVREGEDGEVIEPTEDDKNRAERAAGRLLKAGLPSRSIADVNETRTINLPPGLAEFMIRMLKEDGAELPKGLLAAPIDAEHTPIADTDDHQGEDGEVATSRLAGDGEPPASFPSSPRRSAEGGRLRRWTRRGMEWVR